ncbi:MAG TPA: lipopolysaccharide biosynthesis protein [Methylomirabilota bacterium]|nr:lipopolysaccharide biosynthesis protein [Methylomirabilota bacterium]
MSDSDSTTLRAVAVKAAAWYGATRLWGQALSWAVTILLARLLTPADYGLYAMTLSVLVMLELLQEFGLGTAIVQRQDLNRRQINAVFWVVTTTSTAVTAATFVIAPMVAQFYAEPRLTWTLRILCFNFLLNSLGMVPYNLLTKDINLRHRSLAEAFGVVASSLSALLLAWLGFGVWALVGGHLARAVVLNSALGGFARWRPGFDTSFEGMGSVLAFGFRIAGMQIIGNVSPTVTTFIVARLLGGAAVGFYAMGQALADAPHRLSTAIINQVSLPVFAKLQADRERLGACFLQISRTLAVVSLPLHAGLICTAPDFIPALLSSKWQEMVVPFQMMSLESAIVVLTLTASPLLTALGRADLLLRRSLLSLGATTVVGLVAGPFGLIYLTAARVVAILPLRLFILLPSLKELDLRFSRFAAHLGGPLIATAAMVGVVLGAHVSVLGSAEPLERLLVEVPLGALAYVVTLVGWDRSLSVEIKTIARDLLSRPGA